MKYTELKQLIETGIYPRARQNYQFVTLRLLLLLGTATKQQIAKELSNYNQNSSLMSFNNIPVFDTLDRKNLVLENPPETWTLIDHKILSDEQRYELVQLCDKKIEQQLVEKEFGTKPPNLELTFKDAALSILKDENSSLHYTKICDLILANHLRVTDGKTPHYTLVRDLDEEIKNNPKSLFMKIEPGIYALNFENFGFTVLDDEEQIKNAQKTFIETLSSFGGARGEIFIGFPGPEKNVEGKVSYLPEFDFWWYSTNYDKAKVPRFWNCFGAGEPKWTHLNSITVEINTPLKITRSVSGVFVRDAAGTLYLCRSGRLGGGYTPSGFDKYYPNKERWIKADDKKSTKRDLILISKIDSQKLAQLISEFVHHVNKYKQNPQFRIVSDEKFAIAHELFKLEMLEKEHHTPFENFNHVDFVKQESYKSEVIDAAKKALSIENWNEWINDPYKIFLAVRNATASNISRNLVWHPQTGHTEATFFDEIDQTTKIEMGKQFFDLFLGDENTSDEIGQRFDNLIKFFKEKNLNADWRLLAYLLFLVDPNQYFPILPSKFQKILDYFDVDAKFSEEKSWKVYSFIVQIINEIRERLAIIYSKPDLSIIDAHSFVWILSGALSRNYYAIRPGTDGYDWENQRNNGLIGIHYHTINLSEFAFPNNTLKKSELQSKIKQMIEQEKNQAPAQGTIDAELGQYAQFFAIRPGDRILAIGNNTTLLGIGNAKSKYRFRTDVGTHCHTVDVDWFDTTQKQIPSIDHTRTIKSLDVEEYVKIMSSNVMVSKSDHSNYFEILTRKKQFIFYGPPGTGKTFTANKIAKEFIKTSNVNNMSSTEYEKYLSDCLEQTKKMAYTCKPVTTITFHQSFSYEEFIEGIRPSVDASQTRVIYPIEDGIFKRLCKWAKIHDQEKFVLIIDEINRGNISKIFGELITLIEKDKRNTDVILPYSKESFSIPDNLYIIGTMNTADRSLVHLDAALTRRFARYELLPDPSQLKDIQVEKIHLGKLLEEINKRMRESGMHDNQIGHSYFMDAQNPIEKMSDLQYLFSYEIVPLLKDYFHDDTKSLQKILGQSFIDSDAWKTNTDVFRASLLEEFPQSVT